MPQHSTVVALHSRDSKTRVPVSIQKARTPLRDRSSLRINTRRAIVTCAAWVLSSTFNPAHGQNAAELTELGLEELMDQRIDTVYGASKHDQRVTQAPSSISIVTAEEIKRFGYRTLPDVLRSVRGLYVSDDRNYTYLGMRGFHRPNDYNTRVLVLIDGHRINDNVYDSGTIGREGMIDVDLIERVEVIRGSSSSMYGSSAFLGVINVITKRGASIDGIEVAAGAGTFGTYDSRLTYGAKAASGIEWLVSGSLYESAGADTLYFREFDQRISDDPRASHDGIAHQLDGEEASSLFGKLQYGAFTLSAFAADRTKDVPTASFETVFHGREWTKDQRQYVDLKYDRTFSDGIKLQARGFYDRATYRGDYPYDYAEPGDPPDIVVSKDDTEGEWIGSEWQLTMPVLARHRLILGGEYRESLHADQYVYEEVQPREYYLYDERSSRTYGVFAQGDAVLTEKLTLSAGLRFDGYSAGDLDVVNPRVALIYSPSPRSAFKALYGEAFRAPNPYEHYYTNTEALHVKPALEPETISTYELVYEQYLGLNYRANVSVYSYRVDDLISQTATEDEVLYFDNLESVRARGVELEVEGKFESGALARASYAVQRAEDGTTNTEISSSPRHLGKLNLSAPLYHDRLFAGLELQYHGHVRTLDGSEVDDFIVANVTLLGRRIFKGLELSAGIYNVFDTLYGYPGAEDHLQRVIHQNGRTVRAKFTYAF